VTGPTGHGARQQLYIDRFHPVAVSDCPRFADQKKRKTETPRLALTKGGVNIIVDECVNLNCFFHPGQSQPLLLITSCFNPHPHKFLPNQNFLFLVLQALENNINGIFLQ
jgi:hypothetical protein